MTDTQIPPSALSWLLLAEASVLAPHAGHLPLWMWGIALFVAGWRWLTHLGRLSYPGRTVKTLAVIAASSAVIFAFGRSFSLESATAFLVAASLLKLLEMRYRRDGCIVVFLGCFVLAVGFLFDQGILAAVYGVVSVWLLLSAQIALHRQTRAGSQSRVMRLAGLILLASLPMMLVLYLLFPRLTPLWSFNLHSQEARTGLSDSMSPGDIARLGQSDELAFRVTFAGGRLPPREQLYWRALILDQYDGRRWQMSSGQPPVHWYPTGRQLPDGVSDVVGYEIIQEATGQPWLFALRGVVPQESRTGVSDHDLLVYRREVHNRIRYRAESWLSAPLDAGGLPRLEEHQYLLLPAQVNPQARRWAQTLKLQYPGAQAWTEAVLAYFRQQDFYYSLRPPVLGENDIDEFLFNTRKGFCAHYAGAFVFLARAAGIPARVVAGYQGGEWNAGEHYLTVRQYDAHAWAEIWLPERGWSRIDPTAAVAPERIQSGLEAAVQEEGSFLADQVFSPQKFKGVSWLNQLRLQFDSLNYYWQRWVLSYDGERQKNFLSLVLGLRDYQTALYILGSSFVVFFLLASLLLWWRSRPAQRSAFMRAWQALQRRGRQLGAEPQPGETAAAYLKRLTQQRPQDKALLQWLANEINRVLYGQEDQASAEMPALVRNIRRVRRSLR